MCKFLINIFLLQVLYIVQIQSLCDINIAATCDTVKDVNEFGRRNWTKLIIGEEDAYGYGDPPIELEMGSFDKAKNLESLTIFSQLSDVKERAFFGLNKLKSLTLHYNKLTVLKRGSFSGFRGLLKLDLQNNGIENIVHGTFEKSKITAIDLSNNKLTNIQVDQLNLPSLRRLSLVNNEFYHFATGCFHVNLEELNMHNCKIAEIPTEILRPLKNLKTLILSNNKFTYVDVLPSMQRLETIDLSNNNISLIVNGAFGNTDFLVNLYLGYNQLSTLSDHVFPRNSIIEVFHFHRNKFTYISPKIFARNSKLKEISIGGNPWFCPCFYENEKLLKLRNISQSECDREFFKDGRHPFCIASSDGKCKGDSEVDEELYTAFRSGIVQYDC